MSKSEKTEMKFLDIKMLPTVARGRQSKDWNKDFSQIPVGKMWIVPEGYASGATLREAVKRINKEGTAEYKVTQRTDKASEKTQVYVLRVK